MRQIIYVPLEGLDNRYTVHLDADITEYLKQNRVRFIKIGAPYCTEPPPGHFLNAVDTIRNKSYQISRIAELYSQNQISDETTLFFSDLWFPGIEAIKYLNHFHNVKPKITGIIHAGAFTEGDHLSTAGTWANVFENLLAEMCDTIYVGSQFIKNDLLIKRYFDTGEKIVVTGLPVDSSLIRYITANEKENIIVFTGRLAKDKQPWLFDDLELSLKRFYPHWQFIKTQDLNLDKHDYYKLLARSKVVVSYAIQENFGYGVQEAVYLGCLPVLPNRVCYREQFPKQYLFDTFEQSVDMVEEFMRSYDAIPHPDCVHVNPFKTWFGDYVNTSGRK